MIHLWVTLGWVLAVLFALVGVSMVLLHNWIPALFLLLAILLLLPPVSLLLRNWLHLAIHPAIRITAILILLFGFGRTLLSGARTSIYNSPEVQTQFYEMYDAKMAEWPLPYEHLFVDTRYGRVHVVASGTEGAPPLLLLHASGVGGWSWKFNVGELGKHFMTYSIDTIGDAGKSEYADISGSMKTGRDQAVLYAEISDKLGIGRSSIVGASEGGFIGTNYALYNPDRVEKLALLGPMGYTGATRSVMRITLAQFYPLPFVHRATFRWAFGDDPALNAEFLDWFSLLLKSTYPEKVPPLPLPRESRRRLAVPTMFVFGTRDNLVGDPASARALVADIPGARVEVVDAGHLMGAERPEDINALLLDFLGVQ